jgi:two-component system sensor histidine kinase BaeS
MTLVKKTFLVFLSVFLIQLTVVAILVGFGYRQSENQWRRVRDTQAYETARELLVGSEVGEADPYTGPIAIYDTNRQLVQSGRGMGLHGTMGRSMMAQMKPVHADGRLVGYYATGDVSFGADTANRTLIHTMMIVLAGSLVISFCIAYAAAYYFSRTVSRPADHVAGALQRMQEGDLSEEVRPEGSDELIEIANSVESLRKNLLHEQTVRSQWSQDIAHDLRTPVASVKAQLEGMRDGVLNSDPSRFERTLRELARMETLIHDLELLMRLESPETRISSDTFDAERFLKELHEQVEPILRSRRQTLETSSEVFLIEGDEQLLFRALSNLLHNAMRYGDEGTPIRVSVEKSDGSMRISVHNLGPPISSEELPRITERMYRGEFARATAGSGLGLTIVERIARLHGGTLGITSTEEAGTTLTIQWPYT